MAYNKQIKFALCAGWNADMYTKFLHYSGTKQRAMLAKVILPPFYFLYKVGIIPAPRMRAIASYLAFFRRKADEVYALGDKYAEEVIPSFVRDIALDKLQWHKENGDLIVVVSASLDVYLMRWCKNNGFALICSELKADGGRFSGRYINGDCSCDNKPRVIRSKYDLSQYDKIYAYGDTSEDLAMLNLADEAYLNWELYAVGASL